MGSAAAQRVRWTSHKYPVQGPSTLRSTSRRAKSLEGWRESDLDRALKRPERGKGRAVGFRATLRGAVR